MNKGDRKRTVKKRGRGSEWKRERQTDRKTDRERDREKIND